MRRLFFIAGLLLVLMIVACAAPIEERSSVDTAAAVEENEVAVIKEAVADAPTNEAAPTATNEPNPTATAVPEPTATEGPFVSELPILGVAPDITNETWLNSEPMTLSDNLGKVVLVEFWTYT